MLGFLDDLRRGARLLRRQPGFSFFAILTLAAGIGATVTMFALVKVALLDDLPFVSPDRLAWMYNLRAERDRAPFSIPDLDDYARDNVTLAGLAVFTNWTANLTGVGDPERLEGTRVSGPFFPLLGVKALLGRTLEPRDEDSDARVTVLTYGLWKRRFGGEPGIVGRTVTLNGASYTVVGILPSRFLFPFRDAEIAVPTSLRADLRRADRGANFLRVVARVRPGVTFAQAKDDLDTIAHRLQRTYPDDDARKIGVSLYPLHAEIVRDYGQILWTLFAAVAVLLGIGCGNLANLMLIRAVERRAELSLRVSLGASRRTVARQLAAEAAVLAAAGGILGVGLSTWALAAWKAFGPPGFPGMADVGADAYVLTFAVAVSAATAIACAIMPAWIGSRDLALAVGSVTRASTGNRRQTVIRRGFVALQVGGATVLLVCAGLVAHSVARLEEVNPGFTPDHALSLQLSLPPARYSNREALTQLHDAVAVRLSEMSAVRAFGAVSLLPLSGLLSTVDIRFPDRPDPSPSDVPQAHFRIAGPGYFSAAGIRILAGREFTGHDTSNGRQVAVVSRALAERHWPGEEAVGKYLQIVVPPASGPLEVVGVVSDVKQYGIDGTPTADLYVPLTQMPASQASAVAARQYWVLRTVTDPGVVANAVRRAVHDVDPDVATSSIRTLDQLLASALAPRRVNGRLLQVFGVAAALLSTIGVYAIAAFSVAARRREVAIRSAFGASRRALIRLLVVGELRSISFGVAAGLIVALPVARSLGGLLFATDASQPAAYLAVTAVLFATGGVASLIPAARAAAAGPGELLRA